MKKRILCGAAAYLFLLLSLSLVSCGKAEPRYNYDLTEYVVLGDYMGVRASFEPADEVSEEEIDEALLQLRLEDGDFTAAEKAVEKHDRVTLDFTLSLDGAVLENYSHTDFEVIVGLETNNEVTRAVEGAVLGLAAGQTGETDYTYPLSAASGELSGKTVRLTAKVKKVEVFSEAPLTDSDVNGLTGGAYKTVEALRASLEEDLLSFKRENRRTAVWNAYLETVVVKQYPEKELQEYLEQYRNYCKDMAKAAGVDFSVFLSEYMQMTETEFEQDALVEARRLVKNDMVMVQLSRLMGTTLSEEEYQVGLERYFAGQSSEFTSAEEFEAYYGKEYIKENLIWDKAVETMAENALRIEETNEG